jgi:hypothetical protein
MRAFSDPGSGTNVQTGRSSADITWVAAQSNRRIGERLPTPDLTVEWEVERKGRFRTKTLREPVQVVNASATGAALVAPRVPGMARRSLVPLHVNGHRMTAKVMREEPTAIVGMTAYGVQFLDPIPEAIEFLLTQGGAGNRDELETLWQRAH